MLIIIAVQDYLSLTSFFIAHAMTESVTENTPLVDPANIRRVTAPLGTADIREFFENKELYYIINHSQSKLKGAQFLTYTTNLNLPGDITFDEDLSYEEYSQIMKAYFNQNSITPLTGLHVMAAQLLLLAKGIPDELMPYNLPFDESFTDRFIDENKEQIDKWLHFIDSAPVFAVHSIQRLREHYTPFDNYDVIDDRTYVGANAAVLFTLPDFIFIYFTAKEFKLTFFNHQFNDYIFKGNHLSRWFDHKNNPIAFFMQAFALGEITAEEIDHPIFRTGVFSEEAKLKGIEPYVYDPEYKSPEQPAVQDGQPVVDQPQSGQSVSPEPESGAAEGVSV